MELQPEQPSCILEVIKSPLIFNAFAILSVVVLGCWATSINLTQERLVVLGIVFLFIAGVTVWLNWFAARNPRFLAYGPREYLRESEMAHERRMNRIE
jgi:hypothetical protein